MTYEFEYLMQLLAFSAAGIPIKSPVNQINWDKLLNLAKEQSITALIAYAIKNSQTECPEQHRINIIRFLRNNVINSYNRKFGIINLLDDFEKNNIRAVVLKGFAVADYYAIPECRISGDTDILVNNDYETRALQILKEHNFTVKPRNPRSNQSVCHHPQMGIVELHVALYSKNHIAIKLKDINENLLITEPYIKVITTEGIYYTLGKTDHFIFLVLHMIKHFIDSGTNLRMILDVALFYKNNKSAIDINRFRTIIYILKYNMLLNAIMNAMIVYCGFEKTDYLIFEDVIKDNIEIILNDLEICGGMNYKDDERKDSLNIYNRKKILENNNVIQYNILKIKQSAADCFQSLFPSINHLSLRYSYIKKFPLLLPYVWLHRLIYRGMHFIFTGKIRTNIFNDELNLSDGVKKRIELFKKFGIM